MKTRIVSLTLFLSVLLTSFASCQNPDDEINEIAADTAAEDTETVPETTIYDVLQPKDYDGYTFRILNNNSNAAYINIGENGLTGETLDDAMYNRNLRVAEDLNIAFQIENRDYADTRDTIAMLIPANDDVYDMYTLDLSIMGQHALNGFLWNTNDIDAIDIRNPWWNKTAIDSVTICDYAYPLFGDLHVGFYEVFYPAVFNKSMVEDLNLPDPYQLVKEGTWTLDAMLGMMEAAKADMDGDGKWTVADRYPFTMYQDNGSICLLHTSNTSVFAINEDNIPVWEGLNERFLATYEKLAATAFSVKHNNANHASGDINVMGLEKHRAMMVDGKALFMFEPLGVVKHLRDVDFGVGIVPLPKYDEAQKEYRTYVFIAANAIAIPITNPDAERTGVILEHMAAYSHETVREVYFNKTLDFKYAQDPEAQEMLDIMFAGGTFELGYVYGWGGIVKKIMQNLNEGKTELASQVQALVTAAETDIEAMVDKFTELKENQ